MTRKAKIGFIGAGDFISAMHLLTAHESKIMEIAAIADLNQERLNKHNSKMKVGYITTDYKKLLVDSDIDILVIGTKQDLHAKMIIEGLNAGKWVFCEKPMAETEEDSMAVLAAEKSSKGKLAIGYNRRFAPAIEHTKQLMQSVPRPWYINYRLMFPNAAKQNPNSFYKNHERILYEGCHILDLMCWLLETVPSSVYMTGDRYLNNCCILEFTDGSRISFMCGSMGSFCLWKEYMEVFGCYTAITVSEFVDMRVRGFRNEFDRIFAPHRFERGDEVLKYGFDFYETLSVNRMLNRTDEYSPQSCKELWNMTMEQVKRPVPLPIEVRDHGPLHPECLIVTPDKGWVRSFEAFVESFLNGTEPANANGSAGALSTNLALALLSSLEAGRPLKIDSLLPYLRFAQTHA